MGCYSSKNKFDNYTQEFNFYRILTDIKHSLNKAPTVFGGPCGNVIIKPNSDIYFKMYDVSTFEKFPMKNARVMMELYDVKKIMKNILKHGRGDYKHIKDMILCLAYHVHTEKSKSVVISIYNPRNSKIKENNPLYILNKLIKDFKINSYQSEYEMYNDRTIITYIMYNNGTCTLPYNKVNDIMTKNYEDLVKEWGLIK